MCNSLRATVTLWPATPLPVGAARQLRRLGIDIHRLHLDDHSVVLSRSTSGTLVMQVSLTDLTARSDVDELLDYLRLGSVSYVAWVRRPTEPCGITLVFHAGDASDQDFHVDHHGERLLTQSDLADFADIGTSREMYDALRHWLALPIPQDTQPVSAREVQIAVEPDIGLPPPGSSQI